MKKSLKMTTGKVMDTVRNTLIETNISLGDVTIILKNVSLLVINKYIPNFLNICFIFQSHTI